MVVGSNAVADIELQISRLFRARNIQATTECIFILKRIRDMITYSQIHCTDKYSQHISVIRPIGEMAECSFTN